MRKKSLTSTQVQENLTKIFELIAVVLVAGRFLKKLLQF